MPCYRTLLVLLVTTLTLVTTQKRTRTATNLVKNPDSEDTEYLKVDATGDKIKNNNKKQNKSSTDDEKPKTLSQQIADGKYGLIHKELFSKPQKRPNILSYEPNPEVPNDNIKNLGGLDKNEIWLAENHLLVLRGGSFPPYDDRNNADSPPWPPLDNYKAPLHQVKIPKNPKVPPPFPVQLTENGPLQILGTDFTRTLNGTYEDALNAIPSPEGYPNIYPPFFQQQPNDPNSTNSTSGPAAVPIPFNPSGDYPAPGVPISASFLNGTLPPSLGYLPPGAVILPPPGNQTDYPDYDDPSIYYPPPYSFFYPKDNNSLVPAGPLVPGIILPPPPNFFAPLEDTPSQPTRKPTRYRKPTTTQMTITITKSTTRLPTTKKPTHPQKTVKIYPVKNHQYIHEVKQVTSTTPSPKNTVTNLPEVLTAPRKPSYRPVQTKKPGITILRPVTQPDAYIYENEIPNKPFRHYGPPELNKIAVTTTQVPLRYHTTSHDIETNSVSQENEQRENFKKTKHGKTTYKPAQYYFYEESEKENEAPSRVPKTYSDINEPYYVRPKPIVPVRQRRPQYVYVTAKPYNTQKPRFRFIQQPVEPDSFNLHINKLKSQLNQYYTTPRTNYRAVPKPVYQFSFQAENYRQPQQNSFKPSPQINQQDQFQPIPAKYTVEIQQAIQIIPTEAPKYQNNNNQYYYQHSTERPYYTTPAPEYNQEVTPRPKYLHNVATPRPISEYSFEATPSPVYQGYYTKPDENYFDDRTRTYFNMFGRKIPGGTTPLPKVEPSPVPQHYQQRPLSLEGDTLVNYVHPRPNIDPEAEYIHVKDPPSYPNVVRYTSRDVDNNKPEIIKAIPIEVPSKESQDGSFISYQLPGDDGAHFYFLTPQLAQRKDQGVGFYFSKTRRRRNEETVDR